MRREREGMRNMRRKGMRTMRGKEENEREGGK
jgi:hypothetical protein